jgi:hypothetical protein
MAVARQGLVRPHDRTLLRFLGGPVIMPTLLLFLGGPVIMPTRNRDVALSVQSGGRRVGRARAWSRLRSVRSVTTNVDTRIWQVSDPFSNHVQSVQQQRSVRLAAPARSPRSCTAGTKQATGQGHLAVPLDGELRHVALDQRAECARQRVRSRRPARGRVRTASRLLLCPLVVPVARAARAALRRGPLPPRRTRAACATHALSALRALRAAARSG